MIGESYEEAAITQKSAMITMVFPIIGGILMGLLSPRPAIIIIIVVGVALWLCQMLALFALAWIDRKAFPMLHAPTTLVTFCATYAGCCVVAAYVAHP
jgi:hypothetical protein